MSSAYFTRRQTLHSSERVKSKKLAEELFKKGSSAFLYPFIVRKIILTKDLIQKDTPFSQLLIAVPKKKLRRAVDRNLVKRRVREAYRLNKYILLDKLEENKIAFSLVYVGGKPLDFHFLEDKIKLILETLSINKEDQNK
jgi:ribonuclease P protein component